MTENKRFTTNGYYVYDHQKEDKWLANEVEIGYVVTVMNNLDTKAKERSKALSKLQKENEQLKHDATVLICSNQEYRKENEQLKKDNFKAFALLGDIRALLRTNSYDTVIEKINKFEKEVLK